MLTGSCSPGTSGSGDHAEDVHWWEAWDDDDVKRKRKRAASPDVDDEDAIWQAGLHELPVEVLHAQMTPLYHFCALLI